MTLTVSAPPSVGSLSDISGSTSPEFGNGLLNQTLPTLWLGAADEEQGKQVFNDRVLGAQVSAFRFG